MSDLSPLNSESAASFLARSRDEGEAYADALQAAGVTTERHQGAGLNYGYFGLGEASEAVRLETQRPSLADILLTTPLLRSIAQPLSPQFARTRHELAHITLWFSTPSKETSPFSLSGECGS
jgi:acetyl esterase/lipase